MDLEDILKELQDIIENSDDILLTSIPKLQEELYKVVLEYANNLTVKGVLKRDATTNKNLLILRKKMLGMVQKSKLVKSAATKFLDQYSIIHNLNTGMHKVMNKLGIGKLTKGLINIHKSGVASKLTNETLLADGILLPIQREVFASLTRGDSIKRLKSRLNNIILDDSNVIKSYVSSNTQDSLAEFDGAIQTLVANEYDLTGFRYVGSLIKNSRPQCIRWISQFNGILPREVIAKEIGWAKSNGSGMISDTNSYNFGVNRGGHRCRHRVIATSFSEEEVKEAMRIADIMRIPKDIEHPSLGNQFSNITKSL